MIENLGQVAAIYVGKTAPRNANMVWLDNTVVPYVFKAYNGIEWAELPTGAWIEAYVNGWLVSLQQGTVTTDDDYMLINSGGVNYKMTVKDFVKSSVGNPLDFKGVIRTNSDFPNPSTLESGDMYIIITEPAGGTVTDPYSGKTFSDSEKIVWDSVVNSWESLGKIDVKVDLSTTYSATEVTIHSSAGKETTVVGVTDDNAGVMVPVQKKWLDALSDGSTLTPQGPSTSPYHKHRYSDIVDRIISQQSTGDSTTNPMSQKAITDALDLKLDKDVVVQVSGVATDKIMSQKAVTDAISAAVSGIDLSDYLPLTGGTMSGSIRLANNNVHIEGLGRDKKTNYHILSLDAANRPIFGTLSLGTVIQTNTEDILHKKSTGTYPIYDTYNLPDPAKLSANQTFTGDNTFTGGKFNVVGDKSKFSVNDVGGLRMYYDYADEDTDISRYLDFYTKTSSDTDYTRRGIFGLYASKSTTNSDYAYIGAGDVGSADAQYRFFPAKMVVPNTWNLSTLSDSGIVDIIINNRIFFGSVNSNTYIRSNNSDLYHNKLVGSNTSNYKIWDESNLPSPASTTDLSKYALLAGNNTFTGKNNFNSVQINSSTYAGSYLNIDYTLGVSTFITGRTGGWSQEIGYYSKETKESDSIRRGAFGFLGNGTSLSNADCFYLALGNNSYSNADYRFRSSVLSVPNTFFMRAHSGVQLIGVDSNVRFGSSSVPNYLLSNNTNLFHRKYTSSSTYTDYKIWDASNLPSPASSSDLANYLPLRGGTLTGQLISKGDIDEKIKLWATDNVPNSVIGFYDKDNNLLGRIGWGTGKYATFRVSTGSYYEIWDKFNLPNPVQTSDLEPYATKTWIGEQNYLVESDLTGYATQTWVENKGYLTDTSLDGYATESWVEGKGYLTSASLDSYAKKTDLDSYLPLAGGTMTGNLNIANNKNIASYKKDGSLMNVAYINENDVLVLGNVGLDITLSSNYSDLIHKKSTGEYKIWDASNLASPATQSWVEGKNYITATALAGYATEEWVEAKNYLTSADLSTYATQKWVEDKGYITSAALAGYATEKWVTGKGYLTSSDLTGYAKTSDLEGYATQQWVKDQEYITGADIPPIVIVNTGEGNAVTSITATGHAVTVTKGATYLTQSSLSGYATQKWVQDQAYLTSSSLTGYAKTTDLSSYLPLSAGVDYSLTGELYANAGISTNKITLSNIEISKDSNQRVAVGTKNYYYPMITGSLNIALRPLDANQQGLTISNLGLVDKARMFYDYEDSYLFIEDVNNKTKLDFNNDGLYLTLGSAEKVRLATLTDLSSAGGGVQLSDTNVWTGLNTFQGGLKTSDGTNSYDVWANDILTNPTKYAANASGAGYALSYYTKTFGWREIDTLSLDYLTPGNIVPLTNGGNGYLGLGTNAYASASIFSINTHALYFDGSTTNVLNANSSGVLEYGSTSNYGDFNSRNIRIAYPFVSGGGGGGSSTTYEGGLTIGYYPTNRKSSVTERAKIYCTTDNLYLKDIAKNTQLDFDTDGLYVTTGSTAKVRLATLNDVSGGGGSSVSLDGTNIWTGANTFKSTVQMQSEDLTDARGTQTCGYSIQMTDLARTVDFKLEGHLDRVDAFKVGEYNFDTVSPYATLTVDGGLFDFESSGRLLTKINSKYYEFWNTNNLSNAVKAVPDSIGYNLSFYNGTKWIEFDTLAINELNPRGSKTIADGGSGYVGLYDSAYASAEIASIATKEIIPFDGKSMSSASTGTSTLGTSSSFFKAAYVGEVYTNTLRSTKISTKIGPDPGATVEITDTGIYFTNIDGTKYKLTMEQVS